VVNSLNQQNEIRYFDHPLIKKRSVEFRSYQFNIFESLRNNRNTLVILPTALGKTAILVCAESLYNYKSKRVLVMAPTKPLVSQHMSSFFSVLNIPENCVAVVTGTWNKRRFLTTPRKNQSTYQKEGKEENGTDFNRITFSYW